MPTGDNHLQQLLLTGGTGLLGSAVLDRLKSEKKAVRASRLRLGSSSITHWRDELRGCDAVLHLAARVHIMRDRSSSRLDDFREVNTEGTLGLARLAAQAGVKRFVFVSSIKVNGEHTEPGLAFHHDDAPAPLDPYGISKAEAEDGLRQIASETGMEVVIIRPPLVYGPGVRANFRTMMRWLHRGIPLPLACVTDNRRSLVALDNLVDLLITCLDHPAAANQTFLVSDGEDLSTADLLRRLGRAMGHPARLLPVPTGLLWAGARLLGKGDMAQRLLGSLQVDIEHTRRTLGWAPPVSVDEGLRRTAQGFRP